MNSKSSAGEIGGEVRNIAKTTKAKPAAAPARPRKRLTREERSADVREAIFAAATRVIRQHGYEGASISRITEAAGFAQGTFYLYFGSRQELFDELLPHAGKEMLDFISKRVQGSKDVYDLEERGFRAFFEYLDANPGFIRVLNEAETAAPVAHRKHFKILVDRYLVALDRAAKNGEIKRFDHDELEAVAYIMMAARSYLYLRYVKGNGAKRKLPEKVVKTYMKIMRDGLN